MDRSWIYVRVTGLLLVMACPGLAVAQVEPPELRCVSVMANGGVRLNWENDPAQMAGIAHYEIFQATAPAGPYTLVTTVPTAPPTYLHAGAGADTGARYYYMQSVSNGTPAEVSAPGDTVATMFIQVSQSVPLGSSVVDWNLPHVPPLPTWEPFFIVGQGHSASDLMPKDVVPHTTHHWQRVVDECDGPLAFMVSIADSSGCFSNSNIASAVFQDITAPSIPVITNVTVDTASNRAVLNWEPSPEADTRGYIVVLASAGNTILDTVYGRLNTSYEWVLSAAGNAPEAYTVAAIDSCLRGNPPSPNTSAASQPHTTVHLSTQYDRCAGTIRVHRTDYGGWPVDRYELYLQLDHAGPLSLVATMPPGTHDHLLANVLPQHQYCFVVKAVGTGPGKEALSNLTCRATAYPAVPQWNYLCTATVDAHNRVLVVDSLDQGAFHRRLVLERSFNGLPWQQVAAMVPGNAPVVTFVDDDVLTDIRSYTYRVQVEDSCGNAVATSNKGTSILLQAEPRTDGTNHLRWNGYVEWDGLVDRYEVYRSVADGPFWLVGATADWYFDDDVQDFADTPGKFCYYVVAHEAANSAAINAISTSNIACAVQQEEVWIPNAFIEGGHNNTFKPVLAYVDVERYELLIYNRWGQQIWATTDRDEAWDGRVDGQLVPQGVYAYYCSFVNGKGKTVVRSGTVTFLPGR